MCVHLDTTARDVLVGHLFSQHAAVFLHARQFIARIVHGALDFRNATILKFGGLLVIRGSARVIHLHFERVQPHLLLANRVDDLLFAQPLGARDIALARKLGLIPAQFFEARAAGSVALALEGLFLDGKLDQPAFHLINRRRQTVDLHLDLAGGFVDEVNRLIRQEAVGDVAVAQGGGRDQSRVLNANAVMQFVALLDAAQNRDGGLDTGFRHDDRLKAPFERGVLFDVLSIFVERRRADASSSPRASAGFSMLAASIAPSAAPAPISVCSSSMKRMTLPAAASTSLRTALSRSSNSPRNLDPATMLARSSDSRRLSFSESGTSPVAILCAMPSAIAVLPTPGSPMSTGLFFVRRLNTCITRRISSSRPITGSMLPLRASCVRSRVYFSSA